MTKKTFISLFIFGALTNAALSNIIITGDLSNTRWVAPGESYSGTIEVKNTDSNPQEIRIIQNDYRFDSDGKVEYNEPGTSSRSNAAWIQYSPRRASVPPHENLMINFTVTIPPADSLFGTYWSMIFVEPVPSGSLDPKNMEKKLGIQATTRYGIQIISNINRQSRPKIEFFNPKIVNEKIKRIFEIDLKNTGSLETRPKVTVQLTDTEGKTFGPYEFERHRIYPGTSRRCKFDISGLHQGDYNTIIVADCDDENIFGINQMLKVR
jgi:hypothetical protein